MMSPRIEVITYYGPNGKDLVHPQLSHSVVRTVFLSVHFAIGWLLCNAATQKGDHDFQEAEAVKQRKSACGICAVDKYRESVSTGTLNPC
ncbi:uncharacterized protein PITG_09690 [Phytophthora infestans T30-4]|uniref:Uncharacterized protein n=1 Tax=Phytophthora infestans (strain T30-4) TaxID=403677 RepID=D0NCK8_PHYIT|nr:uncharacterized protein PITG_09690 [Phytophthora infestans T30-4]EEY55723.1 hypothetical protein PITG_09690 [Phytophthora infestans T30-4]|eukprot:XP_002903299.1 hypothetical protein PITG_09690 [Phytophthora infestans T30-4]